MEVAGIEPACISTSDLQSGVKSVRRNFRKYCAPNTTSTPQTVGQSYPCAGQQTHGLVTLWVYNVAGATLNSLSLFSTRLGVSTRPDSTPD